MPAEEMKQHDLYEAAVSMQVATDQLEAAFRDLHRHHRIVAAQHIKLALELVHRGSQWCDKIQTTRAVPLAQRIVEH